jgi:hypothetical protein
MSCGYCDGLIAEINEKYPDCDWNLDEACYMWRERSGDIPDMGIEFEEYDDEALGCPCPYCGELICGWCI